MHDVNVLGFIQCQSAEHDSAQPFNKDVLWVIERGMAGWPVLKSFHTTKPPLPSGTPSRTDLFRFVNTLLTCPENGMG